MSGPIVARNVSLTKTQTHLGDEPLGMSVGVVVLIMLIEVERPAYHRQRYSLGRGSRNCANRERDLTDECIHYSLLTSEIL